MTELEFIEKYCPELTEPQMKYTLWCIANQYFHGVGRALGRSVFWPLVSKNGKSFDVVDTAGYLELSALDGRIGYKSL
jgi:hypothetical protein